MALSTQELLFRLAHMPGTQYDKLINLLQVLGSSDDFLALSKTALRGYGFTPRNTEFINNISQFEAPSTRLWLEVPDHHFIDYYHPNYPQLLKETTNAPLGLFVSGYPEVLIAPQIAIVGSRKATQAGRAFAHQLAADLADLGYVIVSGMALGIDAMAHEGALHRQQATIAVLGHGLDCVYPKRHKSLAKRISEQGALVSEFSLGVGVRADHFPRRNRIISGMCIACIVVEAASQSGSLITAQYALEQNREVFAVPGAIGNGLARGCNQLIKEGATLIESAHDVVVALEGFQSIPIESSTSRGMQEEHPVLEHIDFQVTSLDKIAERSQKSVAELSEVLLKLEIEGNISSVAGGYMRNNSV